MSVNIQLRRGTAAAWTSANPTLAAGEIGYETDTGKIKIGDGTTAWASLAYFTGTHADLAAHNTLGLATQAELDAHASEPVSGDWFGAKHPMISAGGVIEIGRYVDFHHTDGTTDDFDARLHTDGTTDNVLYITNKRILTTDDYVGIQFIIDGGGATITTGAKVDLLIPFACTITQWTVLADQSGSISVGILKDSYANYPPTTPTDLLVTASITTATKNQSGAISHAVAAGDTLRAYVDSVTTIQRASVILKATRS